MKIYEFDALLIKHETLNSAYIEFPFDVEQEFGTKGQVKVLAYFDGYEYRGSLAKMGHSCHFLGLNQKVREAIGKNPGDTIHVKLQKDEAERILELPEEFEKLLDNETKARDFFKALSYSNQKKFTDWIISAKKIETRDKRIKEAIEMLRNGVKK